MKHRFTENEFWTNDNTGHKFGVFTREILLSPNQYTGSFYGIVMSGVCSINDKTYLSAGDFFSKTINIETEPFIHIKHREPFKVFIVHLPDYQCQTISSGSIDFKKGNLRYIDGCTDTLLICPVKLGDPCLNALYFPTGVSQTFHTHPSYRAGCVISGEGKAYYSPTGNEEDANILPLVTGACFFLPEGQLHRFETESEKLVIAAFHPDSDFGPQDVDHPMLNRTVIGNLSNAEKLRGGSTLNAPNLQESA